MQYRDNGCVSMRVVPVERKNLARRRWAAAIDTIVTAQSISFREARASPDWDKMTREQKVERLRSIQDEIDKMREQARLVSYEERMERFCYQQSRRAHLYGGEVPEKEALHMSESCGSVEASCDTMLAAGV